MANAAIFTTTSGLASKMTNNTPIGHVTLCRSSPGPSSLANVTMPVGEGKAATSVMPRSMAAYLPGRERSSRETREGESLDWERRALAVWAC